MRRTMHAGTLALATVLATGGSAGAAEHFVEISEMYSNADGTVQYVILRMEIPFQNLVAGNEMRVEATDGTVLGTFGKFSADVASHGPAVPILIGTADVESAFGVAPDLVVEPGVTNDEADVALPLDGARVCWVTAVGGECGPDGECDCIAYGGFTGDNAPFGRPTTATLGGAQAIKKVTYGLNFVWAANGTDAGIFDNCRDHVLGVPLPANNALEIGTPPLDDPAILVPSYPPGCP